MQINYKEIYKLDNEAVAKQHKVFLDTSMFHHTHIDVIEQLIQLGLFKISDVVISELKKWPMPHKHHKANEHYAWEKTQKILKLIQNKHPDKIIKASYPDLVNDIKSLNPFLSKTLVFRVVHNNFAAIKNVDLHSPAGKQSIENIKEDIIKIRSKAEHALKEGEFNQDFINYDDYEENFINAFTTMVKEVVRLGFKERTTLGFDAEEQFLRKFKDDAIKDIQIIAHYYKHHVNEYRLKSRDKDLVELFMLREAQVEYDEDD